MGVSLGVRERGRGRRARGATSASTITACRVQEDRSSLARPPMAPNTRGGPISDGIFYHHRGNPIIPPPPALSRKVSTSQLYSCRSAYAYTQYWGPLRSLEAWYHPTTVSRAYFALLSVVHYCKHSSYAQRTTTDEKHADAADAGRTDGGKERGAAAAARGT